MLFYCDVTIPHILDGPFDYDVIMKIYATRCTVPFAKGQFLLVLFVVGVYSVQSCCFYVKEGKVHFEHIINYFNHYIPCY